MSIIDRLSAKGNLSPERPCAPPATGQPPIRTLADVQEDPRYSDRAKRIARCLDDRCKADWKWAAWPKVATIAADLGWDATDHGGRKRVERGLKELVDGGDLARLTLRELVAWFDSEGKSRGLDWPKELPRGIRLSLKVCVLNWRISQPPEKLPILPACDSSVALNSGPLPPLSAPSVASTATEVSHGTATEVSQSLLLNVRSLNVRSEPTLNVVRSAPPEEEDTAMGTAPDPDVKIVTAAAPPPGLEERTPLSADLVELLEGQLRNANLPQSVRQNAFNALHESGQLRADLASDPNLKPRSETRPEPPRRMVVIATAPPVVTRARPVASLPVEATVPATLAPKVPATVRAEILAKIGSLSERTSNHEVVLLVAAAVRTLGPHEDLEKTHATFRGIVADVQRGLLPVACLIEAFEEACGRKARKRGAVLIQAVKRWKASNHARERSRA